MRFRKLCLIPNNLPGGDRSAGGACPEKAEERYVLGGAGNFACWEEICFLMIDRENEVLLDGVDVVGSGANATKALIIKLPKTLVAIDRALAVAASKGRVRASTLLVQYASNNAIVRALCSAAHHKKASVVQQLLPWAESKWLDQLVTTASTKGDADIMLLLIPYLSTQCETRIVDHAIESAAAHGHLSTVAILWKFASSKSQDRCLDIAKHHKHLEIVTEIEKGEGIFVRKIS